MGEFFSVACAAAWAMAVVLFRRSGETLPAFELNLFKNLLGVALLVVALSAVGATKVRFSHNGLEWFPEGDALRLAFEEIVRRVESFDFAPGYQIEYEPSYMLRGLTRLDVLVKKSA